jgi:hypothetical protein
MALHAAASISVFVAALQQAPVALQCAPAIPQPEWKFWVTALSPWVGPLLSGVVSIYVAWRVFRWQSGKDRNHWYQDGLLAEWRELVDAVNACEVAVDDMRLSTRTVTIDEFARLRRIALQRMRDRLFIDDAILSPVRKRWADTYEKVKQARAENKPGAEAHNAMVKEIRILARLVRVTAKRQIRLTSAMPLATAQEEED